MILTYYKNCLKYKDGSGYVGIDQHSKISNPVPMDRAFDFESKQEAISYANLFNIVFDIEFEFVAVRVTFEEIKE